MTLLDGYAVILLAPLLCAPVQVLYLKAGERYDLGAVTYIAAGAFSASVCQPPPGDPHAMHLAWLLVSVAAGCFLLRGFAIAYGRPADFTLLSFGQLWATPALIDYQLQKLTDASGLTLTPIRTSPSTIAVIAGAAVIGTAFLIARSDLTERLIALTEAPVQYRLFFGSRLLLAIKLESLALVTYSCAGWLLGLCINDVSADTFRNESIWCILAASLAARSSSIAIIVAPVLVVLVRFGVKSITPARYAGSVIYACLALVLSIAASRSRKSTRDAIADCE